jgi:site-specific recombinase XerD
VFVSRRRAQVLSDSATAERVFERGMEALGISDERHTIHHLRDTFATLHLLQDPGRLFWVSWMLGHRHTSTTLNGYTKDDTRRRTPVVAHRGKEVSKVSLTVDLSFPSFNPASEINKRDLARPLLS